MDNIQALRTMIEKLAQIPDTIECMNKDLKPLGWVVDLQRLTSEAMKLPSKFVKMAENNSGRDFFLKIRTNDQLATHYILSHAFERHIRAQNATEAVRQFLRDNPKTLFRPLTLIAAQEDIGLKGVIPDSTIYTILARLLEKKEIYRHTPGVYRLKTQD